MAKKKSNERKKSSNDELSFSFNMKTFMKVLPILFIIIAMAVAFHVRSGPITLDGLDERMTQNTLQSIQNIVEQEVDAQYPTLSPNYKQEEVQKRMQVIRETREITIQGQTYNVDEVAKQNAESVKNAFKADNGQTYFNAIDPYFFMRQADNYNNLGTIGDAVIDGVGTHTKQAAPRTREAKDPDFHVWLEAQLLKFNGITEDSPIGEKIGAVFLLPVIFAMLSVIPIYMIVRKFTDDLVAFLSTLFLVSVGTFVSRTVAGFVDTDAYNVFFPLCIVAFLIYAFLDNNRVRKIIYSVLAGLFTGLFLWSWISAWFIFAFLILAFIGYIGYSFIATILSKKLHNKKSELTLVNELITLGVYLISSWIFTFLTIKEDIFSETLKGITGSFEDIATISGTNIWPNVFSSVAELNNASFGLIVTSVGGKLVFLIALLGVLFLALDFKKLDEKFKTYNAALIAFSLVWFAMILFGNTFVSLTANSPLFFMLLLFLPIGVALLFGIINGNTDNKVFLAILLAIWVSGTIYMSLNGVRFILLLAPAFAISFGIGLYHIAKIINDFLTNEIDIQGGGKIKTVGYVVIIVIFFVIYSPIFSNASNVSKNTTPNFDDAWYTSMANIRNDSQDDAIITSWWDFGHFFTFVGDRGATFDGGTQTLPQSHWVGKLLMEGDEKVSLDILRMLVCGGNEAHDTFLSFTDGTNADAVKINKVLYDTFGKDIAETRDLVANNKYYDLSNEQVDEIMSYLACEDPVENYVIASGDMIGKAGVWAHWGSWDFTKKYVHDNYKLSTASQIALEIDENETLIAEYIAELEAIDLRAQLENIKRDDLINRWFAPYPGYIPLNGRYEYPCQVSANDSTLLGCQNGAVINLLTGNVTGPLIEQAPIHNLVIPNPQGTTTTVLQNENADVDAVLVPSSTGYNILLAQKPLGEALFTKLYYLHGIGATQFENFDDQNSATGVRIRTFKTIWEDQGDKLSGLDVQSITINATEDELAEIVGDEFIPDNFTDEDVLDEDLVEVEVSEEENLNDTN